MIHSCVGVGGLINRSPDIIYGRRRVGHHVVSFYPYGPKYAGRPQKLKILGSCIPLLSHSKNFKAFISKSSTHNREQSVAEYVRANTDIPGSLVFICTAAPVYANAVLFCSRDGERRQQTADSRRNLLTVVDKNSNSNSFRRWGIQLNCPNSDEQWQLLHLIWNRPRRMRQRLQQSDERVDQPANLQ